VGGRITIITMALVAAFLLVLALFGVRNTLPDEVAWETLGDEGMAVGEGYLGAGLAAVDPLMPPHVNPQVVAGIEIPESGEIFGQPLPLHRPDFREAVAYEILITLSRPMMPMLWMRRAPTILPMIEKKLDAAGFPDDLKYVAVIESDLILTATSPAGARGPWQFIRATGRRYGLRVDRYVDERMNPEKSTDAAIAYLGELREEFSDWFLALAAYNAGENRVAKRIEETDVSSYFDLYLPRETRRYIPRIVAAKWIFEDPEKYGLVRLEPLHVPEYRFVEVKVPRSRANLVKVAREHDVVYSRLRRLNPHILSATLPRGVYRLRVPVEISPEVLAQPDE